MTATPDPKRRRLGRWLAARTGWDEIAAALRAREIPAPGMARHFLGEATLFLLAAQVVTGLLLALHYIPAATDAHESVQALLTQVPHGRLVRSLHYWCSHLLVGCLGLHLVATFVARAYAPPRELTWISGWLLFGLAVAFAFSGQLLPWDEHALAVGRVGTGLIGEVPLVGGVLVRLVAAGPTVTGATLARAAMAHVALLPLLTLLGLGLHLWLVHVHGVTPPPGYESQPPAARPRVSFVAVFLPRSALVMVALASLAFALAVFFPAGHGPPATLVGATAVDARPEWYFLFLYQTLRSVPPKPVVTAALVLGTALLVLPFWDRAPAGARRRRLVLGFGVALALYVVVATVWGLVR
jgi:ubiquinol-cytochrome c reductase cytochrome b subunit